MSKRHVALLVEDEKSMADDVKEMLDSLGHDYQHAETQMDAQRLVDEHEFCYALVDLQIPVDKKSIRPRVEAGHHLIEYIREKYPYGPKRKSKFQILVVSGHAKETPDVVKAMQAGADDFLVKPLSENKVPLSDKIREALRLSGRESHVACAACAAVGRAEQAGATEVGKPSVDLAIPGRRNGKRIEVAIGGKPILLSREPFLLLLRLALGRFRMEEGWVDKCDLGCSKEQGWTGASRLRKELQGLPDGLEAVENNGLGDYRLNPAVVIGQIVAGSLGNDGQIAPLVAEIASLRARKVQLSGRRQA
jgi:CheY-like chemotaxis protein